MSWMRCSGGPWTSESLLAAAASPCPSRWVNGAEACVHAFKGLCSTGGRDGTGEERQPRQDQSRRSCVARGCSADSFRLHGHRMRSGCCPWQIAKKKKNTTTDADVRKCVTYLGLGPVSYGVSRLSSRGKTMQCSLVALQSNAGSKAEKDWRDGGAERRCRNGNRPGDELSMGRTQDSL